MEEESNSKLDVTLEINNTTSPSQLQEVTLDPDATNFSYVGMRSPGAPFNCGRSVKEIDEQMTALRKENFNLKLRIYFLEERMGANFNTDKEDAMKKNIELMVEMENIRKELEDKQELLCQAAKAMEIEDDEKRKEIAIRDKEIANLKSMLGGVECTNIAQYKINSEIIFSSEAYNLDSDRHNTNEIVARLQKTVEDLQSQLTKEQGRADHFENILELTEVTRARCKMLECQIEEKNSKIDNLRYELEKSSDHVLSYNTRLSNLEEELNDKTAQLKNAIFELQDRDTILKNQKKELQDLTMMFHNAQEQMTKQDKKSDKYKSLLLQCENKNSEMMMYIDTLKDKIQKLEVRLEAALDEVKKLSNNSDCLHSTEKQAKCSHTDDELFSAGNSLQLSKTPSKSSSIVNLSSITSPHPTPTKPNSPTKQTRTGPNSKSSNSFVSDDNQTSLTQDKFLQLKRDHYKACKIIKTMIQKKNEYIEQIDKFKMLVCEKENEIQVLKDQVIELTPFINATVGEEKRKSMPEKVTDTNLTASLNPANTENSMDQNEVQLAEQYKELANELENKIEILSATLKEKDNQLSTLKIDLEAKSNQIIDLEFEVLALTQGVSQSLNSTNEYEASLDRERLEKDQIIERLENELKKRTCDLQGLVNKELWEKNRSIEKMQVVLKKKDQLVDNLEKDVFNKELQLKILKEKINDLGIHVNLPPGLLENDVQSQIAPKDMHEQLKSYSDERQQLLNKIKELKVKLNNIPELDEGTVEQYQSDYDQIKQELERSEKLRLENQEICSILSVRLEELCHFLNTLLKQKSVLGFLGAEQTRKLQTVLNKSIDLSRTLSTSMCLNPDQSLLQLTNITSLLNSTRNDSRNFDDILLQDDENNSILSIVPSDITLTYQNHLSRTEVNERNEQKRIIQVLRTQIAELKREIELRDVELDRKARTVENDEQLVDLLVDIQPEVAVDSSKLNTSSTLVAEKSAANTSATFKAKNFENQSESESWSEPDRDVSLARIGLNDESLKRTPNSAGKRNRCGGGCILSTESTEEEESHGLSSRTPSKKGSLTESRQTIISLHEQVCEMEMNLKDKENQLLAAQVAYYEIDNLYKQEQLKVEEIKRHSAQLSCEINVLESKLEETLQLKGSGDRKLEEIKNEHAQLTLRINETNKKLEDAEETKSIAETKIAEQQRVIHALEEFKINMEKTMSVKDKEMHNTINKLEIEKANAISVAQSNEKMLEKAQVNIAAAEEQLQIMRKRESQIREELETNYLNNVKQLEEQYSNKMKIVENEYEVEANKCREAVIKIKEYYEKEYVKKAEAERRYLEADAVRQEVEKLKCVLQESEKKMLAMAAKEMELKCNVQNLQRDHQNKIYELYKDLDNATLQYSEAILEKTKLKNETIALEQKCQQLYSKEKELLEKIEDLQNELLEMQSNVQVQVKLLEHQKSLLEVKVNTLDSDNMLLQSTNSDLREQLMKLHSIKSGEASLSLPNSPSNKALCISYMRQSSDHSGYTSEDFPLSDNGSRTMTVLMSRRNMICGSVQEVDRERVQGNSSPDLGIESDHGRFSSLEANTNVPRPLLPTLELTESMSNLLDPLQDLSCASDGCCKRTKEITNENVELRKRLLRTRRALEETLNRLTHANKQKKEIEKSICKQIHKTSQVLRKAKANLDSGSETDLVKS